MFTHSPRTSFLRGAYSAATAALLALAFLTQASAQTRSGTIRVEPAVGFPNQERTIIFSGVWPNGCPPAANSVVAEPAANPKLITLNISTVMTLVACTQVITPYELRFTYKPTLASTTAIVAKLDRDTLIGVGSFVVGQPTFIRDDLSGNWIDWTRTTSVLNLQHNPTSNTLTGFWGTFDAATATPRWYSLHSSRSVIAEGGFPVDLTATEYTATNPVPVCQGGVAESGGCPHLIGAGKDAAVARITLYSKDVLMLETYAINLSNPPSAGALLQRHYFARSVQ